jgi:DNA-binding NarL/FixJ family response regulator
MSKIRVLITDDHAMFRQGVRTLLTAEPDLEVAGEAKDATEAVNLSRQNRPDVVLMDIGMTGMSSFEATRVIRKERPETRVVFLSMYDDDEYLAECVSIGASGYILKESPAEQLLTAIREVHRGGSYLSPRLLTRLVDDFRTQGRDPATNRDSARSPNANARFSRCLPKVNPSRRSPPPSSSALRPSKPTSST